MHHCASCQGRTVEVMNFGRVALAGAFLKPDAFDSEKRHALTLRFCEQCFLVQVGEQVPAEILFEHYFYFSSATETMRTHFQLMARDLVERFKPESVLEIGCNDGILLRPLQKLGVRRLLGVDPAKNVTPRDLPIINGYWGTEFAKAALGGDRFDLIVANNVFAHIADINDACAAVARTLAPGGSFVFEVNRLDDMVLGLAYDWVYHEHLYYYSLIALDTLLARHGLEVWDLKPIGTHAGSRRYYASAKGTHAVARAVHDQRAQELWAGLDKPARYLQFAQAAQAHSADLKALLAGYGKVAGYGACGRTNTLLQYAGLGAQDIAYIVDDAPAKHGFFTPGTHIEISPAERLVTEPPECVVVFAWSFLAEIQPKLRGFGGEIVIPLPHIYKQSERKAA